MLINKFEKINNVKVLKYTSLNNNINLITYQYMSDDKIHILI